MAAAYGWPEDISADDALARLLALNLGRASARQLERNPIILYRPHNRRIGSNWYIPRA